MGKRNRNRKEKIASLSILKKPINWGIVDSSEDIDRHLYGEKEPAD